MGLIDQINSHYGLFVKYIVQISDQELTILFSEAHVKKDEVRELAFDQGTEHEVSLTNIHPIISDEFCKKCKATFKRFLIYQVIDEGCISWDDAEVFEGKLIRTFTKSRYLDHIDFHMNIDWYKEIEHMKYSHYQIGGLDFIVDVISQEPPTFEEVIQFFVQ